MNIGGEEGNVRKLRAPTPLNLRFIKVDHENLTPLAQIFCGFGVGFGPDWDNLTNYELQAPIKKLIVPGEKIGCGRISAVT